MHINIFIIIDHIKEISTIKDLGVVVQTNLRFSSHFEYVCAKTLGYLGIITRNTKDFKNDILVCLSTLQYIF